MLTGVKFSYLHYITHLLFMDDVLIFGIGSAKDWNTYNEFFKLLCTASRMEVSYQKSCFLQNDVKDDGLTEVLNLFPFKLEAIENGFKYVGYYLNQTVITRRIGCGYQGRWQK